MDQMDYGAVLPPSLMVFFALISWSIRPNLPFLQPKWDELYSYLSSPAGFQVAIHEFDSNI